uniref:Exonuclease domain-containing protein n=1 Tax=Steinernema glaseri TaxID=37863 RepID=A0A1I7ZUM2_9BILA
MEFTGREHCGLDDSMNVARIAIRMMEDGTEFRINEKLVRAEYADDYPSFVSSMPVGMTTKERDRRKWRYDMPYRIVNI